MRFYGQVKGRRFDAEQPEPWLTCHGCGKKRPEREFVLADGTRAKACRRCRVKQRDAYERALEADADRTAANARTRVCSKCKVRRPLGSFEGHRGATMKTCRVCREAYAAKKKARRADENQ